MGHDCVAQSGGGAAFKLARPNAMTDFRRGEGGCVALIAIHVILKMVLGLSGVATTRTFAGLLAQGLAGAIGGYCYYRAVTWRQAAD